MQKLDFDHGLGPPGNELLPPVQVLGTALAL